MFELWNWVGTLNNSARIESRVHSCKHRHTWESCKFRYIRREKPQERFDQVQDMHDDIYTAQHSTAQFNFGLPVCQSHFTNTNVWCFHFSVFVSVSEKLETEWSIVLFSENIAFFFSFLIILVFGVWALWKKVPF